MLRFRPITLAALRRAEPMIQQHYAEGSTYRNEVPLRVNWERYQQQEDFGLLVVVGAFDGEELVGYAPICKVPSLFYSDILSAHVQVVYLKPEYRKGRNGLRFMRYLETTAKVLGCNELRLSVSRGRQREAKLAVHLGFKARELVVTKSL